MQIKQENQNAHYSKKKKKRISLFLYVISFHILNLYIFVVGYKFKVLTFFGKFYLINFIRLFNCDVWEMIISRH